MKKILTIIGFLLLVACEKEQEPMVYPPTLVTSAPTGLTRFDAVLTGSAIKNPASIADCQIGFLFSESASMGDVRKLEAQKSAESDQYTTVMNGLTSGKNYYYCIYASSGESMVKGEVQTFATLANEPPTLENVVAGTPNESNVLLSSGVTDNGGLDVNIRGFAYKIFVEGDPEPTTYDKTVQVPLTSETFSIEVTGLKPNTVYQVRAYASNDKGTGYSETVNLTTEEEKKPRLTCAPATEITAFAAKLTANITHDYGFAATEKGFCYSIENPIPTVDNLKEIVEGSEKNFGVNLSSLNENTTYYVRAYAISEKGTGYSDAAQFTTQQVQKATITQPIASNITYTAATVTAIMEVPAGTEVSQRGICYSKFSTRPGTDGAHVIAEPNGNKITALLTLEEGTNYYVTAYATTRDGTFYSPATQFSTLQTKVATLSLPAISGLDETFATATATISANGGAAIDEKGICWSDALSAPTVGNSKLTDTSTGTSISQKMTNLKVGTKYYVRAYAKNKNGYAYSTTTEFTTKQTYAPTLATLSFANVFETTAQATAEITADGGTAITERGVCYSTTVLTPTIDDKKVVSTVTSGASITVSLTGLTKGTTYHVRAYARNKNGIAYSMARDLTTIENTTPSVSGLVTTAVNDDNATLQATIVSNGGIAITERGFVWSRTIASPTLEDGTTLKSTDKTDQFTARMTGLPYTTRYYIRAYAKNSLGTAYSAPTYFTTIASYVPSVSYPSVTQESITAHTAEVSGSISYDGGAPITETGFWYSNKSAYEPDETNGKLVKAGTTNAAFKVTLTGLGTHSYYYVRAYAKNKNGIAFSSSYTSFTTLQTTPEPDDNPTPGTTTPDSEKR